MSARPTRAGAGADVHVCPACSLPLLQPERWQSTGSGWRVELWCPSCDWGDESVLDEQAAERLEEELDRGVDELACDLQLITSANMREYTDRFASALAADAILPEDF